MHELALHLVDNVLPDVPIRQYVLSPPSELVGLLAARGNIVSAMAKIFVNETFRQMKEAARARGITNPQCGAVLFIQRFSKNLSPFPHFHLLALDGVYQAPENEDEEPKFHPLLPPSPLDLMRLAQAVFNKTTKMLQKEGFIGEEEHPQDELTAMDRWFVRGTQEPSLLHAGKHPRLAYATERAEVAGFSVNAAVAVPAGDQKGRLRLCRYAARPPFAEAQLEELPDGNIRFHFRRPAKTGPSSVTMAPLQFLRKLAWLVPPPKQHQVRYYGVLAPNAKLRRQVVPYVREVRIQPRLDQPMEPSAPSYRSRIRWAQLLKRVYAIDMETCPRCGGELKAIEHVDGPDRIQAILSQLGLLPSQAATGLHKSSMLLFPT